MCGCARVLSGVCGTQIALSVLVAATFIANTTLVAFRLSKHQLIMDNCVRFRGLVA